MSKIEHVIKSIYFLEGSSRQKKWINQLHPLTKLLVSISYIYIVVSFPKYALFPLLTMCCYPLITITLARISLKAMLCQIRVLLVLVCMVGIFNPLFDHQILVKMGPLSFTTGMLSMVTLMIKGIFSVVASYLLIATTSMEEICSALKCFHLPDSFISILLLSYRYFIMFLSELNQMSEAYQLRAVKQKGLHIKAWGSFVGHFLLRSLDRANEIFESMILRGFHGNLTVTPVDKPSLLSLLYAIIWLIIFLIVRLILCH